LLKKKFYKKGAIMNYTNEKIIKKPRLYFSNNLDVSKWENVETELKKLESEKIGSADDLIKFLEKVTELSNILSEEQAWRYINMTRFADKPEYEKKFNEFFAGVVSKVKPY